MLLGRTYVVKEGMEDKWRGRGHGGQVVWKRTWRTYDAREDKWLGRGQVVMEEDMEDKPG